MSASTSGRSKKSKKSAGSSRPSSSSSTSKKNASATSRQGRASTSSTNGHSHNHSSRGSSDSRRNSRDPEESTLSTNPRSGYASNSSQALVPMAAPPRPTRHQRYVPQSNLDPPEESGASTSGSSSSTECTGNQYDPPSMNSNSISQQSPSYAKIYAPKNEQLAVWNEGGDEDQITRVFRVGGDGR